MKNIYELDSKEWKKYKEEFNKTNFKKYTFKIFAFLCIFLLILSGIFFMFTIILDSIEGSESTSYIPMFISFIALSISLAGIGVLVYIDYIHFARWLKVKYNIEY